MTTARPSVDDLATVFRGAWTAADIRGVDRGERTKAGIRAVLDVLDTAPDNAEPKPDSPRFTVERRGEGGEVHDATRPSVVAPFASYFSAERAARALAAGSVNVSDYGWTDL